MSSQDNELNQMENEVEESGYTADSDEVELPVEEVEKPIIVKTARRGRKPAQPAQPAPSTPTSDPTPIDTPTSVDPKREAKRLANQRYRDKNKPVKPIVVEKLVYVMVDKDGNELEKIDPTKLSRKDEKRILIEEEARKKELELGMTLKRLKSGKAKIPRERTEKQKANDVRLVQLNKERREKAKQVKTEVKTEVKKKSLIDALREIVTIPIEDIKEEKKSEPIPIPPKQEEYVKRTKSFAEW